MDFTDLTAGRDFHASPAAWEDEVLYFLMLDRFSDGNERGYHDNAGALVTTGDTPPLRLDDRNNAIRTESDAERWRDAGARWNGGTLDGLRTKLTSLTSTPISAPPTPCGPW